MLCLLFCTPGGLLHSALRPRSSFRLCPCHLPLIYSVLFHHCSSITGYSSSCWLCIVWLSFFPLHIHPFNRPLPCAFLPPHFYITLLISTVLHLLLLVLHCSSVTTAAISHRDTCSIVPGSFPCLKAFLFQRFADPGAVTLGAEGLEELLLG